MYGKNISFPQTLSNTPNIFFYSYQVRLSFNLIKGNPKGKKIGKFLDKQTQDWRIKAHQVFDKLFEGQKPLMTRAEAYEYLQYLMKLDEKDAHIGRFSIAQCQEVIDLLDFKE
jgi:phenylalanine-4-hydroxylase